MGEEAMEALHLFQIFGVSVAREGEEQQVAPEAIPGDMVVMDRLGVQ